MAEPPNQTYFGSANLPECLVWWIFVKVHGFCLDQIEVSTMLYCTKFTNKLIEYNAEICGIGSIVWHCLAGSVDCGMHAL